ncbi:SnoaL-like protein [Chitinophaga niastensis]|uniref:SnoaL-like protein n=1 Tax=Chitinophaga niastensis TaxID=536980 RepID=A0A2P8HQ06_CHINA|nr:nuclear transport factor 2 family protein [Chitinophaga niastensis]PSL48299.1 SnoaL-like protein [Chitinophaga niastensis]
MTQNNSQGTANDAKEVVLSFIKALNEEDYNAGRKYVNDDLLFVGVLGSREGAEVYFSDMERMRIKYKIEKSFVDGDDVCLLYDILIGGVTTYGSGWYRLVDGRISSIKVVFDPRPLLENAK